MMMTTDDREIDRPLHCLSSLFHTHARTHTHAPLKESQKQKKRKNRAGDRLLPNHTTKFTLWSSYREIGGGGRIEKTVRKVGK